MATRSFAQVLLLLTGLAALGGSPRSGRAQPADPVSKVTQLNREALDAIEKREFEKARGILKRALELCQGSGLEKHPIAARTHIHMGVVIIEGFKNRELGLRQFAKALEIEPTIGVTKVLTTPELEEALAEVKEQVASGAARPATAGDASERPRPPVRDDGRSVPSARAPSSEGLTYHTLSEVKQGKNIVVTVTVDERFQFKRLVLAYRPQGADTFFGREMEPVGEGSYSAAIPDRATAGSSVAYYIEAQNEEGEPIASRGTESRPLVVSFGTPGGSPTTREGVEKRASARGEREEREEREEEEDEGGDAGENEGRFFASLLAGSGAGYASGTGEVNADTEVAGAFTGALVGHLRPAFGYWLTDELALSVEGRLQLVSGPTELEKGGRTYSPVPAALAAFVKATWLLGSGSLRPFVSGALGGGQIRHVVTFGNLTDCGPGGAETCVDSVVAGPFLAEVGGGLRYALTPALGLVLSSNALTAAPRFTIHFDVNAGMAVTF